MTGWLNLYTPVGREHVGHNRVDHEKEEYARDGRRIAYACRPELLWDSTTRRPTRATFTTARLTAHGVDQLNR